MDLPATPAPSEVSEEVFRTPRSIARIAVVQALYQITVGKESTADVLADFVANHLDKISDISADQSHFVQVVKQTIERLEDIDAMASAALAEGWTLKRLDNVTLNILRAGICELICFGDIPKPVIIDEYVNVAHAFLDERQTAFINGVLDGIANKVRET